MTHSFAITLLLASAGLLKADSVLFLDTLPGNTYGGVYVGSVQGHIGNAVVDFSLICDDYEAHTSVPSHYNVRSTTGVSDLSGVKFQVSSQLQKYEAAAYLYTQLQGTSNSATIASLQYAIWSIFDANLNIAGVAGAVASRDAALNNTHLASYNYSGMVWYTPTDTTNQEFMAGMVTGITSGDSPAPEPSTWILTGLAGLVFLAKRRLTA